MIRDDLNHCIIKESGDGDLISGYLALSIYGRCARRRHRPLIRERRSSASAETYTKNFTNFDKNDTLFCVYQKIALPNNRAPKIEH